MYCYTSSPFCLSRCTRGTEDVTHITKHFLRQYLYHQHTSSKMKQNSNYSVIRNISIICQNNKCLVEGHEIKENTCKVMKQ